MQTRTPKIHPLVSIMPHMFDAPNQAFMCWFHQSFVVRTQTIFSKDPNHDWVPLLTDLARLAPGHLLTNKVCAIFTFLVCVWTKENR